MAHRVVFVGAGPGSPELLTVAGAEALARAAAVLAPASFQESFRSLLGCKEVESPFQMAHQTLVEWVEARLVRGDVAFLVPGDFGSFCPFQSFVAHFEERARVIPGVGTHAAAMAILKRTLDLPGVAHATVLTSPRAYTRSGERVRLREHARPGHTLVIYMNDIPLPDLLAELWEGFGADVPVALLEKVSCPDELVTLARLSTLAEVVGDRDPFGIGSSDPEPALALVIAGEVLEADEDPSWWDRRYEKIWKPRGVR